MTNYNNDTLDLIPGETPRQKYETLVKIMDLLDKVAYPRRGNEEEDWDIYKVAGLIINENLVAKNQ